MKKAASEWNRIFLIAACWLNIYHICDLIHIYMMYIFVCINNNYCLAGRLNWEWMTEWIAIMINNINIYTWIHVCCSLLHLSLHIWVSEMNRWMECLNDEVERIITHIEAKSTRNFPMYVYVCVLARFDQGLMTFNEYYTKIIIIKWIQNTDIYYYLYILHFWNRIFRLLLYSYLCEEKKIFVMREKRTLFYVQNL